MRKLYVRIYFAVLTSLAVFALAAGLLWHQFGEDGPWSKGYEVAATIAQNALPPAGAPKTEQQAALEKLAANLRADVALFAPDRSPLAAVGAPLPAPEAGRERGGWIHRWGGPAWAVGGLRRGRRAVTGMRLTGCSSYWRFLRSRSVSAPIRWCGG